MLYVHERVLYALYMLYLLYVQVALYRVQVEKAELVALLRGRGSKNQSCATSVSCSSRVRSRSRKCGLAQFGVLSLLEHQADTYLLLEHAFS